MGINVKKILIVDDENVQVESLIRGLKISGFKAEGAISGIEALKILDNSFDLIVTDFEMPGMNGLELLNEIRKIHPTLPVILTTAFGDKELVVDAMHKKCNGFLDKPFTLDVLIQEINKVL